MKSWGKIKLFSCGPITSHWLAVVFLQRKISNDMGRKELGSEELLTVNPLWKMELTDVEIHKMKT